MAETKSLSEFLSSSQQTGRLDWQALPEDLRISNRASWDFNATPSGDDAIPEGFSAQTLKKEVAAKYKDYTVTTLGEDKDKRYFSVTNPAGKKQTLSSLKDKDSLFDTFMYSGGPIALMAAPIAGPALGSALGLSGTAATAVGSGLVSAGVSGAATGDWKSAAKAGLGAGVAGGLGAIPGFSSLPTVAQGALRGATGSLVSSGGDPRQMLLSAIFGGLTPGMAGAGVSPQASRILTALMKSAAQQKLKQPRKP